MKHLGRRAAALLGLVLMLAPVGVAAAHSSRVHTVRPGESIQAALDRARPGDTVLVRPGTYRENLEMTTDRVTLLGHGATLAAPDVPTHRRCSVAVEAESNPFGVCIMGDVVLGQPPTVRRFVRDVTIRGLTVGRFPDTGIIALGALGTRIDRTDIAGGASYSILLAQGTSQSVVTASRMHGGVSAGIYVGDSADARATLVGNEVFDSGVYGIFVRNAAHGRIAGNAISGNCVGVGFVPTRPDPAVVTDWRVTANRIHANNRPCPASAPPSAGVVIAGASDITVTHNVITDNVPAAAAPTRGGGVVMLASAFGGPAQPADNRIQSNVLRGNRPHDLAVLAGGTGNRVSDNVCQTSAPEGLCRSDR